MSLVAVVAAPAHGQELLDRPGDIVVIGSRDVLGVTPERSLGGEEIAGYGLGSVGELLGELAAERSDDLSPVILIDGRRVSGRGDIDSYPTEALAGIDLLPSGFAARLGEGPARRVYNIRLKPRSQLLVGRASAQAATEGDYASTSTDFSATLLAHPRRLHVSARIQNSGALLEDDRSLRQPDRSPAGLGRSRTLRPETRALHLKASATDQLTDWLQGTLLLTYQQSGQRSLRGLSVEGTPIRQRIGSRTGAAELQLKSEARGWLLGFTGSLRDERAETATNDAGSVGFSQAHLSGGTRTRSAFAELQASRAIADLPAGEVQVFAIASLRYDRIRSRQRGSVLADSADFRQAVGEVSAGIDVPIASRASGAGATLGDLGIGLNLARSHATGIGSLASSTVSLRWSPVRTIRLSGSITTGRTPPAVDRLSDPLIATPGVRYFDPQRGETVDVLQISGGDPTLRPQRSASRQLAIHVRPLRSTALELSGEYSRTRNRDLVTALPPASDLVFLAFPERFTRDADGTLRQVDARPVTFTRQSEQRLRSGLRLVLPLDGRTVDPADPMESGDGPARRIHFTLTHSWLLDSSLLIRDELPAVDLLSPGSIGLGGTGRARHRLDLSIGYAEPGLGIRLTGEYAGARYLRLVGEGSGGTLRFSPLAVFDLRAFVAGDRLVPGSTALRGSRLSLAVVNIANARPAVRDETGATPLAYQPAYLDAVGRTVQVEFRRVF